MREILFRGKRTDNGEWVRGYVAEIETAWDKYEYGSLPTEYEKVIIRTDLCVRDICAVLPETVGQYTGLTDKNRKKIFEGDIVQVPLNIKEYFNCEIKFNDGCFDVVQGNIRDYLKVYVANRCVKVIGNIHDNPELLGGTE